MSDEPLLNVASVTIRYPRRGLFASRPAPAVHDMSFSLMQGDTVGLVGESGSGKSTILRAILRLLDVESGAITYQGRDWLSVPAREMRKIRARIGIVAQNPFLSLSPRMNVADILAEPAQVDGGLSKAEIRTRATELLEICGLPPSYLARRATDLSGGQAQRVAIARALMLEPKLMILDEPTSALDVSVQAQILNLLMELRRERGLAVIMVTHDLAVARLLCDDLIVMRQGEVVEQGPAETIMRSPKTEYTQELIG